MVISLAPSYGFVLPMAGGSYLSIREPAQRSAGRERHLMRNLLLVLGLLALAIGVLWIGQGTGMVAWPRTSFMINQLQWAGYGAALGAVGLILIWQSKR
jgi:hypothetical protein